MADAFLMPRKIISGDGAFDRAAEDIAQLGKNVLIVTDSTMVQLGNIKKTADILESAGLRLTVFDGVNSEPTDQVIKQGLDLYKQKGCDCLLAIGGGSPLDAMKAIAMLSVCGGTPGDYLGKCVEAKLPPMIAVPTTAGTGSEATQFTIITDTATQVKMLLKGSSLLPDIAIIDPRFTLSVPAPVTAATGIDALCHAVEAYTSKKAQPLSDTFALSAVKRIFEFLVKAYQNGQDVEARVQMALAALEAGTAFNNASVTIIHGMSRPIGALFHVPHGLSNAMLLEPCLKYIVDGAIPRFADLARHCGMAAADTCDADAADIFIVRTAALVRDLRIPTPEEYGLERDAFLAAIPKMAADAAASGSPSNTRKEIAAPAMEQLYRQLWEKESRD